jgi:hypothetical protein
MLTIISDFVYVANKNTIMTEKINSIDIHVDGSCLASSHQHTTQQGQWSITTQTALFNRTILTPDDGHIGRSM